MRKNSNPAEAADRRSTVQAAGTAIQVLKALADMEGAATLSALAARMDESPAKVHRYLASLIEGDLVLQDAATSRYLLGPGAIRIGLAAMRQSDVLSVAAGELEQLAGAQGLSCFCAVLGNMGPTIVRWAEPAQPVTVNVRVGSVLPYLWSATGRVFAAFGPAQALAPRLAQELAAASPVQRQEIADLAQAEGLLEQVRRTGVAPLRDVLLVGVSAVAAPIHDASGKVAAVLTALGPSGSFDPTPGQGPALQVLQAASSISVRMGARIAQARP